MHPKYSLLVVVPVVMVSCSIATGAVNPVYNESNTSESLGVGQLVVQQVGQLSWSLRKNLIGR